MLNLPAPVCVTVAAAADQPLIALTAETIAAAMSAVEVVRVIAAVVAVSDGEVFVSVSVYEPLVAAMGTVSVGAEKVAAGVDRAVQVVPVAAGVEPGVPTATVIEEVGKSIDSIGKSPRPVRRTRWTSSKAVSPS